MAGRVESSVSERHIYVYSTHMVPHTNNVSYHYKNIPPIEQTSPLITNASAYITTYSLGPNGRINHFFPHSFHFTSVSL